VIHQLSKTCDQRTCS